MFYGGVIIGAMIGVFIGVIIMGLLTSGKIEDYERLLNERRNDGI